MVSLYTTNIKKMGRQVGRVTAFNTFGSIAGSLAAGFILIPLVGIQISLLIFAGFSAAIGMLAFVFGPIGKKRRAITIAVVLPMLLVGVILFPMRPHFGFQQIPTHERAQLLFYRESADQTVMVTEDMGDRSIRRLLINQQQATSTYLPGQRKNHLMGHLPLWACPGARTALVICFGSGGTFGALGHYDLDRVDCVEICSAVIDAASYFTEWNGDVLSREHVKIIVDDGRSYLLTTNEKYDIITLEPMHPGLKGVSALYSVEFYEEAKNRLRPNGVLCQWIPLYSMTGHDARALLATAVKVFPQSSLWIVGSEGILLCARDSLYIDWPWFMRQVSDPAINETLRKVYLDNPWTLLSGYLLGPQGLKRYTQDVPLIWDDHPFIEYSIPRHQHVFPWDDILVLAAKRESPFHIVQGLTLSDRQRFHTTWTAKKESWIARDRGFAAISQGDYAEARGYLEEAYMNNPDDRYAAYFLKEIYWRYGVALSRQQKWTEALRFYARAARLDPRDPKARFYFGVALYNDGRPTQALIEIRQALQLKPDFEEAKDFLRRIEEPD
jgi:spermidine synthase